MHWEYILLNGFRKANTVFIAEFHVHVKMSVIMLLSWKNLDKTHVSLYVCIGHPYSTGLRGCLNSKGNTLGQAVHTSEN